MITKQSLTGCRRTNARSELVDDEAEEEENVRDDQVEGENARDDDDALLNIGDAVEMCVP